MIFLSLGYQTTNMLTSNDRNVFFHSSGGKKSEIGATGLDQDFSWAALPPEALGENLFHAPSSFWHLPALPGLLPPPLISKASIFVSVLPSYHLLCVWIKYPSAPPLHKDGSSGLVAKSCPTLCNPVDCSPPGSSVHGFPQARILEWVAIPFSRGSSQRRGRTQVSCIAGGFFTTWDTREGYLLSVYYILPLW